MMAEKGQITTPRVGALVLAAGMSTRAGSINKLLHLYHGEPLILHVVRTVIASCVTETLVVLGHEAKQVEAAIAGNPIGVLHNSQYQQGIATSLVLGISHLHEYDAVVVCLGDMPHVTPDAINTLVDAMTRHRQKSFFIPVFHGNRGNPVLITKDRYDEVSDLKGDSGARKLIQRLPQLTHEVPINSKGVREDFDTPEQLKRLDSQ